MNNARKITLYDISTPVTMGLSSDQRYEEQRDQLAYVKRYLLQLPPGKWLQDNDIKVNWFAAYCDNMTRFRLGCYAIVNEEQEVLFAATHGRPIEKIFVVPGDLWMTQEK